MSKIVSIDVDGTLVDYENHLPDSAVRAIRAARGGGALAHDLEAQVDVQHQAVTVAFGLGRPGR